MYLTATLAAVCRRVKSSCLASSLIALVGCGASYETIKIKSYRFALVGDNAAQYAPVFAQLMTDFNAASGYNAMQLVNSEGDANSTIVITNGLEQKSGKVGWGQMLSVSKSDSPVTIPGKTPKRTVTYAMRVEFDEKYIQDNSDMSDMSKRINNQKLFFHECGHGLEMGHDMQNQANVMYYNIVGNKDFSSFFKQVTAYLADQG